MFDRRSQVILSAEAVFSEKGYYSSSVSDIIEKANIARGTFYLYFKNKRALFECILDNLFNEIDSRIKRVIVSPDLEPPIIQLKNNFKRVFRLLIQKKHLTIILLNYALGVDEDFNAKVENFYRKVKQQIMDALEIGIEIGIVRNCNIELTATYSMGILKEVLREHIIQNLNPLSMEERIDEIIDDLLTFGLKGLKK